VLIDAVRVTNDHIPIFRPIISQLAHKVTKFQGLHRDFIRSRVWVRRAVEMRALPIGPLSAATCSGLDFLFRPANDKTGQH
jgi:hypothetical protein